MSEVLSELKAMESICAALQSLEPAARNRAVWWLLGALRTSDGQIPTSALISESQNLTDGSSQNTYDSPAIRSAPAIPPAIPPAIQGVDSALERTPKEFISHKNPQSVVERIVCLAFYLTHHRETSMFGSREIEALNTDAACSSINRTRDLDNASRSGYLVPAPDRKKQISAKGEDLVKALPDREAVKVALSKYSSQKRRKPSSSTKKRETSNGDAE